MTRSRGCNDSRDSTYRYRSPYNWQTPRRDYVSLYRCTSPPYPHTVNTTPTYRLTPTSVRYPPFPPEKETSGRVQSTSNDGMQWVVSISRSTCSPKPRSRTHQCTALLCHCPIAQRGAVLGGERTCRSRALRCANQERDNQHPIMSRGWSLKWVQDGSVTAIGLLQDCSKKQDDVRGRMMDRIWTRSLPR